jgi:hypothetical protein
MSKFKVGDRVKRISKSGGYFPAWHGNIGEVYTVKGFSFGGLVIEGLVGSCKAECFELTWQPKQGEMIEVCNGEVFGSQKRERLFVKMFDGEFLCQDQPNGRFFRTWQHARQPKPDTTITAKDGSSIELSEESFNAIFGEAE